MSNRNITRAVRFALLTAGAVGAGLYGAGSYAQDSELEEVVVTGTRVKTPGVESNSPITSVGAQEIAFAQPVAVEDIIKQLPGAVPAIGPGTNNGSGGGATIDLRGLGPSRSLVLVDGRRFVPFNLTAQVDTNSIPIALVERIDLVTGGASAVYGADAVAGVVNFVLKRDFEGLDLTGSMGTSDKGDANRYRGDLTMGANLADGRGNVVLSVGYTETEALLQGDRSIGAVSLSSTSGAPQGSGTGVPVIITAPFTRQMNTATGTWVPVYETYNFNPTNFFVTPLERYQVTGLARYEITDWAEAYAQVFYTRSDVDTQLASSGTFLNSYRVPIGNPYLPQAAREQLCALPSVNIPLANCVVGNATEIPMSIGRRITELGPRLNSFENKTFQYTVGLRGDITDHWSYDAYWSHGEADQIQTRGNWGSLSKVQQALRALNTSNCTVTSNGCVPLNVFGPEGSITPEMVKFINLSSLLTQTVEQDVASLSFSGDLGAFKSPLAASPIGLAVGAEYRSMFAGTKSDSASQIQGEVLGTGAPTPDREGEIKFEELYAEALIPILSDKPFAYAINLEVGYRTTDFESSEGTQDYETYKYGGEWAPIESLRFRGMFQRAVRAPNINELYAPLVTGLSNLATDPCGGAVINAAEANTAGTLSNLCRQTGVPLQFIGQLPQPSAGQINVLSGGNPTVGPEEADTLTVGVVWEPSFINGLMVTLDYYDIDLQKYISTPSSTDILTDCYDASRNPGLTLNQACSQVLRSPVTGTFNGVDAPGVVLPLSNLGQLQTDGFDLTIRYQYDFQNWGRLVLGFNANKVENWTFQATPSSINRDCLGYYSIACGAPLPELVWNQRTTWSIGAFDVGYLWRHIDSVTEEPIGTAFLPKFSKIPSYDYIDLYGSWQASEKLSLNVTVNNVTNEDPPLVGNTIGTTSTNSGNTFPQSYDVIGTYYTVGFSLKL